MKLSIGSENKRLPDLLFKPPRLSQNDNSTGCGLWEVRAFSLVPLDQFTNLDFYLIQFVALHKDLQGSDWRRVADTPYHNAATCFEIPLISSPNIAVILWLI